ncbi:MAG: SagB/ThcOx family dehydrogenase [Candidatus Hermodarchaeota archaeon]
MTEGIGKEFMKKTRYEYLEESDQSKGMPQPPIEVEYEAKQPIIDLPLPRDITLKTIALRNAIENRRSVRKYSGEPLTLMEISWLLWCTQGVKEIISRPVTLRNVPSAGARHALETFLLINNVESIQPGLYRYLATKHKIIPINLEDSLISEKLADACLEQSHVKKSAVTFFWVAIVYRMYWRYGERGYRYLHLDAGHVCQNLYLAAEKIGCGVCAIAAYDDIQVNEILGVDGEDAFTIYLATVGKIR